METRLVSLLVRAGLPRPATQHAVTVGGTTYRLDLAYPAERVGVEFDSYLHHGSRSKFVRDLARRNALTSAGWTVLHATAPEVRQSAGELCDAVRSALERAA